jgi:hypothetical protein
VVNVVLSQKEGARSPTSPSNPRTGVAHNLSTFGWRYQKRHFSKNNLSIFGWRYQKRGSHLSTFESTNSIKTVCLRYHLQKRNSHASL